MNIPNTSNNNFGSVHSQIAPLSLQITIVMLTLMPILLVYPFMQKHFKTGMLTGAIKG